MKVILGSWIPLEIGSRHVGIRRVNEKDHPSQPYIVLRQVTFDDWFNQEGRVTGKDNPDELEFAKKNGYFYEISVD